MTGKKSVGRRLVSGKSATQTRPVNTTWQPSRAARQPAAGAGCRWTPSLLVLVVVLWAIPSVAFAQTFGRSVGGAWRATRPSPQVNRQASPHPAVARIIVTEKVATSYGSGTLVDVEGDYGLVITNWHVVRDAAGEVTVVFPDGFRSSARVLKVDGDWDLAALVVWRPNADPVPIAAAAPRPGDVLTIAGYGSGRYRAATGRCTQYVAPGVNFPYEMVEVSVAARPGDSGGPIFNERGELAGVLFGADGGSTTGSYAGRLRWFLASVAPDLGKSESISIASRPSVARKALRDDASSASGRTAAAPAASPRADNEPGDADTTSQADTPRPIIWQDVAGETIFQQAKTVLAAIGLLAVLLWVMRFIGA